MLPGGRRFSVRHFPVLSSLTFRFALIFAVLAGSSTAATPPPEYRLGDVAEEDVITPVPLLVVNPEATEALRQKVAQQVPFIVRYTPQSLAQAEQELRQSVKTAQELFLKSLQLNLGGRVPSYTDLDGAAFADAVRDVARELPKDFPLAHFAAIWVRGLGDASAVDTMLKPLREVMAQPILPAKTVTPLPPNQSIRLVSVRDEQPLAQSLESGGTVMLSNKVLSLWRARRLVATYFPAGQEGFGRFAATFVRPTAEPDAALTEIARARRIDGVTVNDTYEAAEVIVRRGQTVDRKALSALGVLREKSLIGTLQTKLEHEQTVAGQIGVQTKWIVVTVVAGCGTLALLMWRFRTRTSTAFVGHTGALSLADEPRDAAWRERALLAEGRADRAQQALRSGMLSWLRDAMFRMLFRHRAQLLSAQQKAEVEMRELESRLEKLQAPLQDRIATYEKRIEDLERELAAKGEENRELIAARISFAKQQLSMERERGRFEAN